MISQKVLLSNRVVSIIFVQAVLVFIKRFVDLKLFIELIASHPINQLKHLVSEEEVEQENVEPQEKDSTWTTLKGSLRHEPLNDVVPVDERRTFIAEWNYRSIGLLKLRIGYHPVSK